MYSLAEIGILNAIIATVFALLVLVIGRCLMRPAIIHALWILVLLKLVTPPVVEVPIGFRLERLASLAATADKDTAPLPREARGASRSISTSPVYVASRPASLSGPSQAGSDKSTASESPTSATTPVSATAQAPSSLDFRQWVSLTLPILLYLWVAGSCVWFIIQGWRIALFARLVSRGRPVAKAVQEQTAQLAATIGLRRSPTVWVVPATMAPALWGTGWRARVIFPADLLERVDRDARAMLLTHELAHYYRRDDLVRVLELVVTGLFWWHPVVWIARRQIEVVEEHCCDAWVVAQFPQQPRRYAEALLDTIDFLCEEQAWVAPVASGLGHAAFLRARICKIMSGVAPQSMSASARLAIVATAAALLPLQPQLFEGVFHRTDTALESLRSETEKTRLLLETATPASSADEAASSAVLTVNGHSAGEPLPVVTDGVSVWAVVDAPEGRYQAVAKTDGQFILRDVFQRRHFDLSEYQVSAIAFAPHRDLLAAGSQDSHIYVFDCASGDPIASFAGHATGVRSVAVSLDGRFLASGSRDGVVKLWDLDYEREVSTKIPDQASAVTSVRFSEDGRLLAIASGDWMHPNEGLVTIWDLRGGTTQHQLRLPSAVGAVAFEDGRLIVGEWNGRTSRWDIESGTSEVVTMMGKDFVSAASFAADAQYLLRAAANGEVPTVAAAVWFQRMDRDRNGMLTWNEFQGSAGAFRTLDTDADEVVSWKELEQGRDI